MFNLLKRKQSEPEEPPILNSMERTLLITERNSFRDNELKLIRATVTATRKDIEANKHLSQRERSIIVDTLNTISSHALDVAFLMNRDRLHELGAKKQRRNRFHGVK